jgi:hypothetical protein
MKLWQKNFLYAALLFMAIFYICVFFLAAPSVTSVLASAKATAVSEEYAISRALDSTFNNIRLQSHQNAAATFAEYYVERGIYLEIGGDDDVLFSSLPYAAAPDPGMLAWVTHDEETYIAIKDQLTSGYSLVFMKSATDAVNASLRQCLLSAAAGTGVILALCLLLYFTLKKINQPIDRLAHELRTPLTAISGYAQALMIAKLSDEQRYNATRYILDESKRLADISEKLLTISSLRERGAKRENVDIEALFSHAQRTYGQVAYAVQWKRVTGDRVLLQSLINNLVANAIKASPEGSIVDLAALDRQIIVRDSGKGMSLEQLEYVNHPGRNECPQKRSGLGIPLCHEIAKLHRAVLHFTSEAGQGTQAVISFTTR